ncbi:monoamine oxidase [Talaromyces proteolyticus]|uniref:Amine oxidase n=1 Tax=Talaromyces proteolyticus TaxID=1131652 RepID=A0AAD4PZ56_9EURO|nr:monoamine oxidase [Talaromyces proteolyticus]KAH8698666.1 monoamine oxidase [Talaromyces proteolyticus]
MLDQFDVAVIGAGMAGIIAARDLSNKGFSVVLIEARDRLGGRTYTEQALGSHIDLGGGYVHWTQANVWRELHRYGISIFPPPTANKVYWLAQDKVHSGTEADYFSLVDPLIARLVADARARFPMPFDISIVDNSDIEKQSLEDRISSLNLSPYERDVLDGVLSGIVHSYEEQGVAQLLLCVAAYFGDYKAFFETASFWSIEGGTRALVNAIMGETKAELHLSSPVRSIFDDGTRVKVTTRAGLEVYARRAIVALPLNTLQDLQFTPDVSPRARAFIDQKNPVMGGKLWVRVKGHIEPFTGFAPVGKHPINAVRTEQYHNGDTLIMCILSDAAAIQGDDKHAVQEALRLFVPDIEVVDTASHNWAVDEFSKGGWMFHRPGSLTEAAPLMRQPHGLVHFAGSDIAAMDVGAIEGALETGVAAARDVYAALSTS